MESKIDSEDTSSSCKRQTRLDVLAFSSFEALKIKITLYTYATSPLVIYSFTKKLNFFFIMMTSTTTTLFLLFVLSLLQLVTNAQFFDDAVNSYIFKPISTQTTLVKTSGGSTIETDAVIQVSNTLNSGAFYVGNFKVGVKARPAAFNYRYKEVGRVPKAIFTQTIKVCSVVDTQAYAEAQQLLPQHTIGDVSALYQAQGDAASPVSSVKRRLLSVDTTDPSSADSVTTLNMKKALSALSQLLAKDKSLNSGDTWNTLNTYFSLLQDDRNAQQGHDTDRDIILGQLVANVNAYGKQLDNIDKAIRNAASDQKQQLDDYQKAVDAAREQDRIQLQNQIYQGFYFISNVSQTVADLSSTLANQTLHTESEFIKQNEINAGINAALYFELTQTSLKRAASLAYFNIVKDLPNTLIPLVTDPGTPPVDGGVLTGSDSRLLLESFYVLYDQPSTLGQGQKRVGVKNFKWYLNSEMQLENANPSVSLRNIYMSFATSDCTRPYYDTSLPWTDINGTLVLENPSTNTSSICSSWIEVVDQVCVGTNSFDWTLSVNNEYPALTTAICGQHAVTTTNTVLKTLDDFQTYMNTRQCDATPSFVSYSGVYVVTSINTAARQFIPQDPFAGSANCYASLETQISVENTVFGYMVKLAYAAYTLIFNRLLALEQKKYGRLAGGLTYDALPFDYVPPVGNSTNTGAYSPRMCHRVTFNLAHVDTLPVYAVYPDPSSLVTKQVIREITKVDPTVILDNTEGLLLDTPEVFTENILLVDDAEHLLPKSSLVVGSISDPVYWYDVPSHLLSVSSNIFARKNTVTYYLMPPNTLSTWTLPVFQKANNDLYSALDAAVGANLFAVPVAYDSLGYPVCNVGAGLLDAFTMNGQTVNSSRTCIGSNTWTTNTALVSTINSVCASNHAFGGRTPVKLYNRGIDLLSVTDFSASWADGSQGFALHFLFEGLGSSTPAGLTLTNNVVISVSVDYVNNAVFVNVRNGLSSQIVSSTYKALFNGIKHSVLIFFTGFSVADHVGIAVDGWLDTYANLNVTIPASRSGSAWNPPTLGIPGIESVYGISWPLGLPSATFSATLVEALRVCSMAVSENHCSPSKYNEQILFASPVNSVSGPGRACPVASTSLFRSSLLDSSIVNVAQTSKSIFTSSDGFTVSWWMHLSTAWITLNGPGQSIYPVFTFQSGVSPNIMQMYVFIDSSKHVNVKVIQGASLFVLLTSTRYTTTDTLSASKMVVRLQAGILSLYIDQQLESQTAFVGFSATNSGFTITQMSSQGVVSLLRVYSYTLSNLALTFDAACDAEVGYDYTNPVGYCRTINGAATPTSMYCRSASACRGNCETYAMFHGATSTFDNTEMKQCDDGYLAPDCIHACAHADANTGVCIQNDINDPAAYGSTKTLVPGGTWCDVLKNYQVSAGLPISGQSDAAMTLASRKYIMQVLMKIPSGQIIADATTVGGTCPLITPSSLTGNNAQLILTNPSTDTLFVRAVWSTPFACDALLDVHKVITAHFSALLDVPTCGNVSVVVFTGVITSGNTGVQYVECTGLDIENIASVVAATSAAQQSSIYETAVNVSDLALAKSLQVSVGISTVLFTLLSEFGLDLAAYRMIYNAAVQNALDADNAANTTHTGFNTNHTFTDVCGEGTVCGSLTNFTTPPPVDISKLPGAKNIIFQTELTTSNEWLKQLFSNAGDFFSFFGLFAFFYVMLRFIENYGPKVYYYLRQPESYVNIVKLLCGVQDVNEKTASQDATKNVAAATAEGEFLIQHDRHGLQKL